MSTFSVSQDVVDLIQEIIAKNGWQLTSEVRYYPGSEAGDGYASKHVAVVLPLATGDLKIFVKYALALTHTEDMPIGKFYGNETYFYEKLRPAFQKFLDDRFIPFESVPKCLGSSDKYVIALENIKEQGYRLFDRTKAMDEAHITITLKTFARFHGTSFAFKDQERETYDILVGNWDGDFMEGQKKDSPSTKMFLGMIQDGLDQLDAVKDKRLLDRCDVDVLGDTIIEVRKTVDEYSIFTQGDCWCNNIMFRYEDDTHNSTPVNVMLVDWQLFRPASPVFDISYFFFTIATKDELDKLNFYLDAYYDELSEHIKRLGSDPELLYPKWVFLKEWKRHCKYGFAMAFMLFKFMLVNKDEVPKMDEIDFEKLKETDKVELFQKFDNQEEYLRRLRILGNFMVDNDYI